MLFGTRERPCSGPHKCTRALVHTNCVHSRVDGREHGWEMHTHLPTNAPGPCSRTVNTGCLNHALVQYCRYRWHWLVTYEIFATQVNPFRF